MRVELHLIQNFAPACLNRDDTNTPKDCEFGGVRRARISSQCLKRAARFHPAFQEALGAHLADRTKLLKHKLVGRLVGGGKSEEEAGQAVEWFVPHLLARKDETRKKVWDAEHPGLLKTLVFISPLEADEIAEAMVADWGELTKAKKPSAKAVEGLVAKCKGHVAAADVALFGRMMADQPDLNVEAACQVAHAISTHRVNMEMDFYTAVDDLQPREDTGAGMMGVTGFNSACFYRYSLVDAKELADNLKGDAELARRAIEAFLRASVVAIPSGKQNSMAAQNLPSLVLTVVRASGPPCSLANAFAKPVRPGRDEDLVEASIAALDAYWGRITGAYGAAGVAARPVLCVEDVELPNLADQRVDTLEALVSRTMEAVAAGGGSA
jgi:CRISPR system Cascade subunit CasC